MAIVNKTSGIPSEKEHILLEVNNGDLEALEPFEKNGILKMRKAFFALL